MRRLRRLTEEECYARCYGASDEAVRIVHVEPRRRRAGARLSGEEVRRLFEQRLASRDAEAA